MSHLRYAFYSVLHGAGWFLEYCRHLMWPLPFNVFFVLLFGCVCQQNRHTHRQPRRENWHSCQPVANGCTHTRSPADEIRICKAITLSDIILSSFRCLGDRKKFTQLLNPRPTKYWKRKWNGGECGLKQPRRWNCTYSWLSFQFVAAKSTKGSNQLAKFSIKWLTNLSGFILYQLTVFSLHMKRINLGKAKLWKRNSNVVGRYHAVVIRLIWAW